jgi:predicted CopG family antitoxin
LANFHISVPEELYDWLVEERKKRKASSVQDVIRQILKEVKGEAEKHG